MKTWTRRSPEPRCGGANCGIDLHVGDLVQVITVPGVKRSKVRCWDCAEGPIPDDVPVPEPEPVAKLTLKQRHDLRPGGLTALADIAKDWKQRASGEREPGSDDS